MSKFGDGAALVAARGFCMGSGAGVSSRGCPAQFVCADFVLGGVAASQR